MAAASCSRSSSCDECPYPSDPHQHPMFVYLASDSRFTIDKTKQDIIPFVLLCANPFDDIKRQNRHPGYTGADHTTKSGAGHLQVELILGPMSHTTAVEIQQQWRSRSRKLVQRIQTGITLAGEFKLNIHCRDVKWTTSIIQQSK